MKKKIIIFIFIIVVIFFTSHQFLSKKEEEFQLDADKARLEHLVYWSGLIEVYKIKTGYYPFQNLLTKNSNTPIMVKIATKEQSSHMKGYMTNFNEISVKDFIAEIESKLGQQIKEFYDIQKIPTSSPVGYFYFASNKGYLIWTTCISCGVTMISTLLMDGSAPTVNIASEGMKPEVTKALTRKEMISHPIFKEWQSRPYLKEGFVRARENETISDSKK